MPDPVPEPLASSLLCRCCDPAALDGAGDGEPSPFDCCFGQARAEEAILFGLAMRQPGHNLFVLGPAGRGRHRTVRRLLSAAAAQGAPLQDWCYVYNFAAPNRPRLLQLPAGIGASLQRDMERFTAELAPAIQSALEGEQYRSQIEALHEELKKRQEDALTALGDQARKSGVVLVRTGKGFVFVPLKNGETMSQEEFEALPAKQRKKLKQQIHDFGEELQQLLKTFPRWHSELQAAVSAATQETIGFAVGHLIEELAARYAGHPQVTTFLAEVERDLQTSGQALREQEVEDGDTVRLALSGQISVQRYEVNLLVDNDGRNEAPVIEEDNPTYPNLLGRVEQFMHMGALVTNFTLIRAGALHRANGGYLMLDAERLLAWPYAWWGLKRVLKSGQIRIEPLGEMFGLANTQSLEPEPVPLAVKVVLIGERRLYYLLKQLDPEFDAFFKIQADFEDAVARDGQSEARYARLVAALAGKAGLLPFERPALARLVEYGARLAGDADKLSTDLRRLHDALQQADQLAREAGHGSVSAEEVDGALAAQQERARRPHRQICEAIQRDTLLIATSGMRTGQINGLAVIDLAGHAFGHPVRISATVRIGDGKVLDIERETELGGPLHSKGVLILSSLLAARYGAKTPLALAASLVFEQSYGPVEGDSASLAELMALLSALAEAPLKQALALTGSINQHGEVQAIGGVNEKIEGYFDVCQARGLDGSHGVLIPRANLAHLMLRTEVVDAAAAGLFQVFVVDHVDQAFSLLTGLAADELDLRIRRRLAQFARARQRLLYGGRSQRNGA